MPRTPALPVDERRADADLREWAGGLDPGAEPVIGAPYYYGVGIESQGLRPRPSIASMYCNY
jgi:hypothetical protein